MNQQIEHIIKYYLHLPQPDRPILLSNHYLRDKDHSGRLQRTFLAFAVYLACMKEAQSQPIAIMVTASHNPPGYNGLKAQKMTGELNLNHEEVNLVLNSEENFIQLVKSSHQVHQNRKRFFIGRDARLSSPELVQIIKNGLVSIGAEVVDLGAVTTPEFFSLAAYFGEEQVSSLQKVSHNYYSQVELCWKCAISQLEQNRSKLARKKICLDMSNGVGAISLLKYGFLDQFFELKAVNTEDFSQPNVGCGAQWLFKHFKKTGVMPVLNGYPESEQYYFFDGDCDRIIAKSIYCDNLNTGDELNACFITLAVKLLHEAGLQEFCQDAVAVGNINSNLGLDRYLKSNKIQMLRTPVGMRHVWTQAQKHQLSSFFQNNGHGCLYLSRRLIEALNKKNDRWQSRLLLSINGLTRNNSRGYALHNMLVLQIYFAYFGTQTANLFQAVYLYEEAFHLQIPAQFKNEQAGVMSLRCPEKLVQQVARLQEEFSEEYILIRKSDTQPSLRLTIQGDKPKCMQIAEHLVPLIRDACSI